MLARICLLLGALMAWPGQPLAEGGYRLMMIEAAHCIHCRVFNRDMAPIYRLSPEGRIAPLEHLQLGAPPPEGVTFASRPGLTPTFILIGPDGQEIDRLIGYPGEAFFWGYLTRMFTRAGISAETAGPDG